MRRSWRKSRRDFSDLGLGCWYNPVQKPVRDGSGEGKKTMIDKQEIKRVATEIGIAARAERVVLFGSYAKGNAGSDSDVDLLIIAESELPRFKRSRMLYNLFRPHPFAMDLVVYTPQEVEKGKQSPVSFVSRVLREGEVVYERRDRDRPPVGGKSRG